MTNELGVDNIWYGEGLWVIVFIKNSNRWTLKCGLYLDKWPGREAYTIREVPPKMV